MKFLASVVQNVDNAIHRRDLYPVHHAIVFPNTFPLDSDLSGGWFTYHQGDGYSLTDPAYTNMKTKGTGLSIVFNGDGEGRISLPQVLFTRLTLMQTASFQRTLQFRFSGQQPSHYRLSAKKKLNPQ